MIIAFSGKIGSGKDTSMLMAAHCIANLINPNKVSISSSDIIDIIDKGNKNDLDQLLIYYLDLIKFEKAYFGKNVKKIACILLDCTLEQLEDIDFKNSLVPEIYTRCVLNIPSIGIENLIFSTYDKAESYYKSLLEKYKYLFDSTQHTIITERLKVRDFLVMIGNDFGRDIIHPDIWSNLLFQEYQKKYIGKFNDFEEPEHQYPDEYKYPNWFITDCRYKNEADSIIKHNGIIIRLNRKTDVPEHIAKNQSETDLDTFDFRYKIDNSNGNLTKLYNSISEILTKIFKINENSISY